MQIITSDIIIVIAGTFLLFLIFGFIIYFVIVYNKRYLKNEAEKAELIKSFELGKLNSQLEIQEQTLKNISGEIHDNIGQVLSLAGLQISTINTEEKKKVEYARELIDKAITDLRDLSKSMDKDRINSIGLTAALEHELNILEKTGKYSTSFIVNDDIEFLSEDASIILFRIIQEIINNIIKHSIANQVNITINSYLDDIQLIITDNGIGFDLTKVSTNGQGMNNINNRAKLIGGKISINSGINKGTTITISIPKRAQNV